ncbi:MAG: anthranilate synthase component II [Ferrimicrobium sp.]
MTALRVLIIDNYDSFVYNLVQYVGELGATPIVRRHDQLPDNLNLDALPDRVIISPGPGRPEEATGALWALSVLSMSIPTLGVCLGHQAIAMHFGASVVRAMAVMHGRTSTIHHDGAAIYEGIDKPFLATRYHSLVVDPESIPDCLIVTASTEDGVIMGVRHRDLPIEGVQFHPESILSEHGHRLIQNFLKA